MPEPAQAQSQAGTLPERTLADEPLGPAGVAVGLAPAAAIFPDLRVRDEESRIPLPSAHPVAVTGGAETVHGLGLSRAVADLTEIALVHGDLRGMLARLCRVSVDLLDATAAGVVLFEADGEIRLTATSDEVAFQAEAQRLDALRTSGDPSPGVEEGLELWAIPMRANGEAIGNLDLYNTPTTIMLAHRAEIAQTLATVAAGLVWRVRAHERDRLRADQLQHALDSRIVIEQAKGILSAELGLTIDEAFEVLRSATRNRRMRIHQLATAVIEHRIELGTSRVSRSVVAGSPRSPRSPRGAR